MMPILEARKIKVAEQTKQFTTYKNCPLCRGYFHSAKACIFRTHVEHFNLLQKKMDQYSDEINTTTRMVIPTTDSDTDSEEEEVQYSDESEEEDCGTYMMIVHHGDSSDEESMDEDEDSFASKLKHVTMFDKILTIVARQKKEDQQDGQTEDQEEQDSQEEEDQEEKDQDQDFQDKEDHDDNGDDQNGRGQNQAKRESQPENPADNAEKEEPKTTTRPAER